MKKFLNSAWGVAALCIVGIGLLAWRVVLPILGGSDDGAEWAMMDEEDWLDETADFAAVRNTLTAIDVGNLNWNATPMRDPFSLQRDIDPGDLAVMHTQVSQSRPPTVTALVSGSNSRLAVVDGQLVSEGDRIGGYRVTRIDAAGVQLLDESNGVAEVIGVKRR